MIAQPDYVIFATSVQASNWPEFVTDDLHESLTM
jgi:hypothetical protein